MLPVRVFGPLRVEAEQFGVTHSNGLSRVPGTTCGRKKTQEEVPDFENGEKVWWRCRISKNCKLANAVIPENNPRRVQRKFAETC